MTSPPLPPVSEGDDPSSAARLRRDRAAAVAVLRDELLPVLLDLAGGADRGSVVVSAALSELPEQPDPDNALRAVQSMRTLGLIDIEEDSDTVGTLDVSMRLTADGVRAAEKLVIRPVGRLIRVRSATSWPPLPTPTNEQQPVLQAAWDLFVEQGRRWPTVDQIDERLDGQVHVHKLLRETSPELVRGDWLGGSVPRTEHVVQLTVAGVAACRGTAPDIECFLRVMALAVAKSKTERSAAILRSADVLADMDTGENTQALKERIARVGLLLTREPWGDGPVEFEEPYGLVWTAPVSADVRDFADLAGIEDYWLRRPAQYPYTAFNPYAPPGPSVGASAPGLESSVTTTATTAGIRYQVFISSTYKDLIDEREVVTQAVLRMGRCLPAGMELFSASSRPPWDVIRGILDGTDYLVLIIGNRSGALVPGEAISYTEKEYQYAIDNDIPVLAFLSSNERPILPRDIEKEKNQGALAAFRVRVQSAATTEEWTTKEHLAARVPNALWKAFEDTPRPGWVRGDLRSAQTGLGPGPE